MRTPVILALLVAGCGPAPATAAPARMSTATPAALPPTASPLPGTEDWLTLTGAGGYRLRFPQNFQPQERVSGYYVLLAGPTLTAFYIDERGRMTLAEYRTAQAAALLQPRFTSVTAGDFAGFIAQGIMAAGMQRGQPSKTAYLDLGGRALAFGCNGSYCQSDLFERILATFQRAA